MKRYRCTLPLQATPYGLIRAENAKTAAALFAMVSTTTDGEELLSPPAEGESVDVCVIELAGESDEPIGCAETYRVTNLESELFPRLIGRGVRPFLQTLNRFPELN